MDAYQILVVVLSVMLGILLIISVVFLILLVKILKQVKRITDKADHVMDNMESVGDFFRRTSGPLAIGRYIGGLVRSVKDKGNRRGKR